MPEEVRVQVLEPLAHETLPVRLSDEQASLHTLLVTLVHAGGSDLHLTPGAPPTIRVHGRLVHLTDYEPLTPADTDTLVRAAVTDEQWRRFERDQELDLAYSIDGVSRFRVNIYTQRGTRSAAFRAIPHQIKSVEELDLPPSVANFAALHRGLVLVTGPTGSGKTTTLAALLDHANSTRSAHILTIEDPIEFLHHHRRCLVNQREVGSDTGSFATALRQALRQDPDIILVGELRDLETTSVALTAAETGHLVLATLHTQSAAQTIDRIIDIFPAHQQQEVRAQLSMTLQGVVTQALCPRADGTGRTVITEVMTGTPAIRNLIREGKTFQIPSFLQSGANDGMRSFDQHLAQRVAAQIVTFDQALEICHSPEEFKRLAGRR
jgi:twitching motility protein PilT